MRDEMAEALESSADVRRHADGELTHRLVMFDGEAQILVSAPVDRQFVQFLERGYEVLRICLVCVLDAEIVHDDGEGEVAFHMPN